MYYLGYWDNNEYVPIDLSKLEYFKDKKTTDILEIANFTTGFAYKNELQRFLYIEGLLPSPEKSLQYMIAKGKKGEKTYQPIKNGSSICLTEDYPYLKVGSVTTTLKEHQYDSSFWASLLAFNIRKLGFINTMKDSITKEISNPEQLKDTLIRLKKVAPEPLIVQDIDYLIKFITQYSNSIYDSEKYDYLSVTLSEIIDNLAIFNDSVIDMYRILCSNTNRSKLPVINNLFGLYQIAVRANEIGVENYEYQNDENHNFLEYLNGFVESLIYMYDSEKHQYKTKNGQRQIHSRNLVDLALFLKNYFAIRHYEPEFVQVINPLDDDEHEEFLEEEDFTRMNTTPEEEGYSLRKNSSFYNHD